MSPALTREHDAQEQSMPTIVHEQVTESDKKLKHDASLMNFLEEAIPAGYKTQQPPTDAG